MKRFSTEACLFFKVYAPPPSALQFNIILFGESQGPYSPWSLKAARGRKRLLKTSETEVERRFGGRARRNRFRAAFSRRTNGAAQSTLGEALWLPAPSGGRP